MQDSFPVKGYIQLKVAPIIIFLSMTFGSALSQPSNYPEIFGEHWKKAVVWEKENRTWMKHALEEREINYPLAISIIFPELVRYSSLRDKMETTLLKALYVNLGEEYADFSIGIFQMKPSFAKAVIEKMPVLFENMDETGDEISFRRSIVNDLENPELQLHYLIAFIKICEQEFYAYAKDEPAKVKFYSTSYNYGFQKKASEIDSCSYKKHFSINFSKSVNYSYSDISMFWYRQFIIEGISF